MSKWNFFTRILTMREARQFQKAFDKDLKLPTESIGVIYHHSYERGMHNYEINKLPNRYFCYSYNSYEPTMSSLKRFAYELGIPILEANVGHAPLQPAYLPGKYEKRMASSFIVINSAIEIWDSKRTFLQRTFGPLSPDNDGPEIIGTRARVREILII